MRAVLTDGGDGRMGGESEYEADLEAGGWLLAEVTGVAAQVHMGLVEVQVCFQVDDWPAVQDHGPGRLIRSHQYVYNHDWLIDWLLIDWWQLNFYDNL